MAETRKAHERRVREGFFEKYIHGEGIDIGCGRIDTYDGIDLIHPSAIAHDKDMCDATTMDIYEDNRFDYVSSSHVLEHLDDPITAIRNWFRILKPGGYLIISVPHRDLYEKKRTLPSLWNADHKYFLLPDINEPPCTFSFKDIIESALGISRVEDSRNTYEIVEFAVRNQGWQPCPVEVHSSGEISIEAILKRLI